MNPRPFFLLLLGTVQALAVDSAIPTAFPATRYENLVASSPFALATPQAAVAAPENVAGFAEGWYVGGLARMEGKDFVTVKSRDQSVQFSLFGTEENRENGISLERVDWSPEIGKSKVTIRKGEELASLEFNEAELQNSTAAAAPTVVPNNGAVARPNIPRPGGIPAPGGIRPPVANPNGLVPPRPGALRQPNGNRLPLPGGQVPNAGQPKAGGPNANNPPNGAARRRIRVINSGQPNQ